MSIEVLCEWVAAYGGVWRVFWRSVAKMVIKVRRWAKEAAEGALSALRVLKRRSRRWGPGAVLRGFESLDRALKASVRCAVLGGLKEESRMRSVLD